MKTYYIVETIPTGNGWTKRDTISENIGYGIGYCLGTLWYFLKWGSVGAALTFLVYFLIH